MHIRKAMQTDLEEIRSIARQAYAIYVEAIGQAPAPMVADFASQIAGHQIWVGEKAKKVCAYVVAYRCADHMHLENLAVHPDCQGKGVGRELVSFVEDMAREEKLVAVKLYTNTKMTGNLNWYPAIGYLETHRAEEDGFSRVFFSKKV